VYVVLYRYVYMYRLMYSDIGSDSMYKSGGVFGGFLVFCPPHLRVENSPIILVILVENSGD